MSKPQITKAKFYAAPRQQGDEALVTVHFNPTSLQHVITNTLEENRTDHKQYVTKSSAKLTMDLIFDTTDKPEDVRQTTKKVANFMKTDERQRRRVPPVVVFEWGAFSFQGLVESYKETIDFFSSEGVPLRATVNLTLSRQEKVFEESGGGGGGAGGGAGGGGAAGEDAVDVPAGGDQSATDTATASGDPGAGRDIATANGEESMRFPSGPMTVDPSVQLSSPVAFASGGASLSAGAGVGVSGGVGVGGGIGLSGGASLGLSGGVGVGGGAGFEVGGAAGFGVVGGGVVGGGAGFSASASLGGSASAGVTASAGAFAGLRATARGRRTSSLDAGRLIKQSASVSVATDRGARFRLGGRAVFEESASLGAGVRADAGLRARIRFEEG